MSAKISIIGRIAEAERELAMRHEVYLQRVASRQMHQREMLARQELQTHYLLERRIRAQDARRAEGDAR